MDSRNIYTCDLKRYEKEIGGSKKHSLQLRWLKSFRMCKIYRHKNPLMYLYWRTLYRKLSKITHIQISWTTSIGAGFYIAHYGRIIINPKAIIGSNVNISTGVIIGQENRGKRKGVPVIGNEVWIGANAVIVGNVRIGSDVLIAPNSYVNCDVPDHSIVLGNPCQIRHKLNATESYVENKISL